MTPFSLTAPKPIKHCNLIIVWGEKYTRKCQTKNENNIQCSIQYGKNVGTCRGRESEKQGLWISDNEDKIKGEREKEMWKEAYAGNRESTNKLKDKV